MWMRKHSRLHLPSPPARPGEAPDFSYVALSAAGAVARPDVNARARDIGSLSVELVRVLDDAGVAVGPCIRTSTRRNCRSGCGTCC